MLCFSLLFEFSSFFVVYQLRIHSKYISNFVSFTILGIYIGLYFDFVITKIVYWMTMCCDVNVR